MKEVKPPMQSVSIPAPMWDRARILSLLTGKETVRKFIREGIERHLDFVESTLPEHHKRLVREISIAQLAEAPPELGKKFPPKNQ
jgi:hypothetical protein